MLSWWSPSREQANKHCPQSRGWDGSSSPTASAVTTTFAPLQPNAVKHRTDSQIQATQQELEHALCWLRNWYLAQTREHHRVKVHVVLEWSMSPWTTVVVTEWPSLWKSSQILVPSQFFRVYTFIRRPPFDSLPLNYLMITNILF